MTGPVIPPQWLTVPLENVILQIVGGGTPSKSKPEYYQGEIPWMSVKDMNKHVLRDTVDHISQLAVDNSSTNVIPAGTPIIATRMSLGKIVIADFDSAINQDLKALFLPAEIHRDYLVYWYRSVARNIEQMGTGTTVKGIRLEALKGLDFALPPATEQKVIADKLDTLLAQVENTKARLERIPKILKRFRQSVLAAAVSGRLTEEWRNSAENQDFEPFEIPSTWTATSIGKVAEVKGGKRLPKGDVLVSENTGYPYIRAGQLKNGTVKTGQETRNAQFFITESVRKVISRYTVNAGDAYITIVGASIGDAGIIPESHHGANLTENAAKITNFKFSLEPRYLSTWLRSEHLQDLIRLETKSAAQGKLALNRIKTLPLPLPPVEEQTEIVHQVDQLFAHADRIEHEVNNALTRVNNLTQSILAKAFRGELTEQWRKDNPDLISGEHSAEALLEKINTERAAVSPTKRTRQRKATA